MENSKMMKISLVVVIIGVLLIGSYAFLANTSSNLVDIDSERFEQILESGDGTFVYIGRHTCPVCYEFEPILEEALDNLNKELYYYNTHYAREADAERMIELLDSLEVESVPTIVYVENGQVIDMLVGLHNEIEITSFFRNNQ